MSIYPAYISKDNLNHGKRIILLMILRGKELHYLAVKKRLITLGIKRNNVKTR